MRAFGLVCTCAGCTMKRLREANRSKDASTTYLSEQEQAILRKALFKSVEVITPSKGNDDEH